MQPGRRWEIVCARWDLARGSVPAEGVLDSWAATCNVHAAYAWGNAKLTDTLESVIAKDSIGYVVHVDISSCKTNCETFLSSQQLPQLASLNNSWCMFELCFN